MYQHQHRHDDSVSYNRLQDQILHACCINCLRQILLICSCREDWKIHLAFSVNAFEQLRWYQFRTWVWVAGVIRERLVFWPPKWTHAESLCCNTLGVHKVVLLFFGIYKTVSLDLRAIFTYRRLSAETSTYFCTCATMVLLLARKCTLTL